MKDVTFPYSRTKMIEFVMLLERMEIVLKRALNIYIERRLQN